MALINNKALFNVSSGSQLDFVMPVEELGVELDSCFFQNGKRPADKILSRDEMIVS